MTVYVMLTVDLNRGVTEDQRKRFNEKLEELQWRKLSLTTTWQAGFKEDVSEAGAIQTTKNDVARAAAYAGVAQYEAAAEAGRNPPSVWNQSG